MLKFVVEVTQEQYDAIVRRSEKVCGWEDEDFNPMDYSGGNFDDCYEMGRNHADVDAAQEILSLLGNAVAE